MDLSLFGEAEDPSLGAGHEHPLQVVLVVALHPGQRLSAPDPPTVEVHGHPLHEPLVTHRDHHVLVGDRVLHLAHVLLRLLQDHRAALVAVLLHHLVQLVQERLELTLLALQDLSQVLDPGLELLQPGPQLLLLQRREPAQAHVEDGIRLDLGKAQRILKPIGGLGTVLGRPDDLDHLLDGVEGGDEPLGDVALGLGLLQLVAGAPDDDLDPVVPVRLQDLLEGPFLRLPVVQGQHDRPEGGLEIRALVEDLEDPPRVRAPLQLDDEPEPVPIRLVAKLADLVRLPLSGQVGDLLDDLGLRDGVGQLRDHELLLPAPERLLHDPGAHHDPPAALVVHVPDPVGAHHVAPRGEVGAGDELHEVIHGAVGILDQHPDRRRHLPQVVGRHVGAHPHGDAAGAVDQQVRKDGRKDLGLLQAVVEVGDEVDGVPADVGEEVHGHLGEARLGVAVGRRRVAVDGAEVALPVHQGIAEREVLDHADQRVVDRRVAMGVVLAQHLTHHRGALLGSPVRKEPQLVHGVEDPPVHGLEAVAHVGKRPLDDDAHGVVQERLPHLVLDQTGEDPLSLLSRRHSISCTMVGGISSWPTPGSTGTPRSRHRRRRGPFRAGRCRRLARWRGGRKAPKDGSRDPGGIAAPGTPHVTPDEGQPPPFELSSIRASTRLRSSGGAPSPRFTRSSVSRKERSKTSRG